MRNKARTRSIPGPVSGANVGPQACGRRKRCFTCYKRSSDWTRITHKKSRCGSGNDLLVQNGVAVPEISRTKSANFTHNGDSKFTGTQD